MNKIGYCGCQFSSDARWGGMLISGRVLRLSVTFNTWSLCVNYQNTLIKINNPQKKIFCKYVTGVLGLRLAAAAASFLHDEVGCSLRVSRLCWCFFVCVTLWFSVLASHLLFYSCLTYRSCTSLPIIFVSRLYDCFWVLCRMRYHWSNFQVCHHLWPLRPGCRSVLSYVYIF